MRFEYYHSGLDDVRKLSVDGTVSSSIHFSHWEGNRTPLTVKADTSTEIALNLVGSLEREQLTEGLNELERRDVHIGSAQGHWTLNRREMTPAIKFMDQWGTLCASTLSPEVVAEEMRAALIETETTNIGAAQSG